MEKVPGVQDVGIFKVDGQPSLVIQVDRAKAARYGIAPADINAAVQAAVGGAPVTQMVEGDRRFDITVRYPEQYRNNPDAIGSILLPAAMAAACHLSQVANIGVRQGSFQIYREGGRRYIPIKFSVRGRDLAATIDRSAASADAEDHAAAWLHLRVGRASSTRSRRNRSVSRSSSRSACLRSLCLLYTQFNTWLDALIILATLPFAAIGGILALLVTHTSFSISAAVGFTSLTGVATLGAVVFLSGIRRAQKHCTARQAGLT